MLKFFTRIFDSNEREVNNILPIIEEISFLEEKIKKIKDSDFPKKTKELRERIASGESVYLVLPEAFALVREAAKRTIGERPYDVQLVAATVLSQGKIAEQKTGEGKTLSAVPAMYLRALTGYAVHLVTVNDYLARRDAGWMGAVFNFLGMTVSSIISEKSFMYDTEFTDDNANDYRLIHLKEITRKEAYKADIVYGINSEFGFDYLRDNMVMNKEDLVQRGYYFAIIDEVDSVLIDEARTPHIISMPDTQPSARYYEYAKLVEKLSAQTDFKIDEKLRTAHLTDHGISKVEKMFGIKDIYEKDFDTVYHLEAALKAKTLFHKEKDYIVRDNQVILVDEFTGRLLEGRRLSEGLHQAIEAKENVSIQQESKTLATVSLQNYFRMYEKISGMTGTAVTEAEEFHKIYKLDVVAIPTNKPMVRNDLSDVIYKTTRAKVAAIVSEIENAYKKGQPVLVGTTSIEKNELISEFLKRKGVKHEILNAKNHLREALIIKDAGRRHAVTVATNMAGRGVDIILGGQPPSRYELKYQSASGKKEYEKEISQWRVEHENVKKLGGLFVIGTEKHESRRIDNQLRGRAGRQGDPGKSIFVISLEDDLMRVFGGEQISNLMTRFNFPEDTPLTHPIVSRVIEQAQVKVEGFNFEIRKSLLDYDDVLNKQREIIYKERRSIVEDTENPIDLVQKKVQTEIEKHVEFNLALTDDGNGRKNIIGEFSNIVPFDEASRDQLQKQIEQKPGKSEIVEFLMGLVKYVDKNREQIYTNDGLKYVSKVVCLSTIDNLWMDHLTSMEDLRTGIGLRGYGQRDPLVEYKNESFQMFERLMDSIDDGIVHRFYKVNIGVNPSPVEQPKNVVLNQPITEIGEKSQTKTSGKKPGRNDSCWCGSGKKYKRCHYPN